MDTDAKISIKILTNMVINHGKVGFIPEMQGLFNIRKSSNVDYITLIEQRKKKLLIFSIDAKALNKIQYPFIRNTRKTRNRKELPQHDKGLLKKKSTANIMCNGSESILKALPLMPGTKQDAYYLLLLKVLPRAIRQKKEIKLERKK